MVNAESLIQSIGDKPLPPVDTWNPDYCGELDLLIKSDGTWIYSGTPLTRHKIKLLFSRIIKKEGEQYFLVTPVEKVGIQIEWQPFIIIDYNVIERDNRRIYQFSDNLENKVLLTNTPQIEFSEYDGQRLPILQIRRNLFASFSRNCYYRLLNDADIVVKNNRNQVVINSNGLEFFLGEYDDQ